MYWALMASVSALTSMPSILSGLGLGLDICPERPCSFISRWRSATMSPEPLLTIFCLARASGRHRGRQAKDDETRACS